jgi:hypothetical protein
VHGGDANGDDLPAGSLKPEDLHLLRIVSLDQVRDILDKYQALNIPKEHHLIFAEQLTGRRDAWFIEAGDKGLIYLTSVVPRLGATLNLLFWDGKLTKDRREAVRSVVAEAMELFALPRIGALCPYTNLPLRQVLKKIGFVLEGVARKGYLTPDGSYIDMFLYGVTSEEVSQWPVARLTASLARVS